MLSVWAVTAQRGSAARFRPLREGLAEVLQRAPSTQTASTGRTWGRPVGCTDAGQYRRVSARTARTNSHSKTVVGSAAIR